MPGGYGTDESLPWSPHGDTGYQAPSGAVTSTDGSNQGIANIKAQAEAAKTDPKILADIAASTVSQPTTSFVDYEGAMSNEAREALREEQGFKRPSMMDTKNYGDT